MMVVHMIKLASGESILGNVIEAKEGILTVQNAIEVFSQGGEGTRAPIMIAQPWLPLIDILGDNLIHLNMRHVIASSKVNAELYEFYVETVGQILIRHSDEIETHEKTKKLRLTSIGSNSNNETVH
jgi:hypothetical protein